MITALPSLSNTPKYCKALRDAFCSASVFFFPTPLPMILPYLSNTPCVNILLLGGPTTEMLTYSGVSLNSL